MYCTSAMSSSNKQIQLSMKNNLITAFIYYILFYFYSDWVKLQEII